jgi:hypothetical protein
MTIESVPPASLLSMPRFLPPLARGDRGEGGWRVRSGTARDGAVAAYRIGRLASRDRSVRVKGIFRALRSARSLTVGLPPPPPSPLPSPPPVDPLDKFEAIGGRAAAGGSSLVTRAALVLYFPSASLGVAMGCRFRRHLFARSSRGGDGGFAIVARISPFIERGGGGDD